MTLSIEDLRSMLPVPAGPRASSPAGSWTRAMQDAQTWNWFHGAVPPFATNQMPTAMGRTSAALPTTPASPGAREPFPEVHGGALARAATGVATGHARNEAPVVIGGSALHPSVAGIPPSDAFFNEIQPGESSAPEGAESHELPSRERLAAERDSLRVHVETTEGHVAVWLGMDGGPVFAAERAAALLPELRRSAAAAGQRLVLVVCNGKAVAVAGPGPVKETS